VVTVSPLELKPMDVEKYDEDDDEGELEDVDS
jgi:hypothetical protein